MTLSDQDIVAAIKTGRIKVRPKPDFSQQLGSCSLDFHLGNTFQVFDHTRRPYVDLKHHLKPEEYMKKIVILGEEPFIIQPNDFVLASTKEYIEIGDDLIGRIEGRSSLARLGILVHSTAGVFDAGWRGVITMEIGNLGVLPVTLYPGMRFCAMTFEELKSPTTRPYWKNIRAKYAGARTPEASKLDQEFGPERERKRSSKKR